MATAALARSTRTSANLLVLMLGILVFLNYVDRGSISVAAPLMKGDLKLSNEAYGWAFSAFFWVYAPVQLFAGWLCDRFSVYKLLALGLFIWAASTLLMGLIGGFISLLCLRILLGIGESLAFPGSSKIFARHVPAERRGAANAALAMGIAFGPAFGTLAGGLIVAHWGWRIMFIFFGLMTLMWLLPWRQLMRSFVEAPRTEESQRVNIAALAGKWPLWSMSVVHCLGNYCFYFLLAWLPLYLTKQRGFTITQMTLLASLGYGVQGCCAFALGRFSDWWTCSGRSEAACRRWMMVASQSVAAIAILGLAFAHSASAIGILLCFAGAASAALSINLYAIGQMFAGARASGTWIGVQNSLGNLSGIFGPIVTGIVVDRAGFGSAFVLTAGVAAFGALWWAVVVPPIRQVELG